MADITVTVSGPGGCIGHIGIYIKWILKGAGISVTLVDDHPSEADEIEVLKHHASLKKKMDVEIKMDHRPWGG